MCLLAQQPYVKVEREVTSISQKDVELPRTIKLYSDRVETKYRTFKLRDVLDMTYRQFGSSRGLLYIHTTSGLFSYTVKTDTTSFIHIFKEQKEKLKEVDVE